LGETCWGCCEEEHREDEVRSRVTRVVGPLNTTTMGIAMTPPPTMIHHGPICFSPEEYDVNTYTIPNVSALKGPGKRIKSELLVCVELMLELRNCTLTYVHSTAYWHMEKAFDGLSSAPLSLWLFNFQA
jgi:hypothetical protein